MATKRIAYDDIGQGPPLVLVHGALSDRRVFGYQQLSLSRQLRTITVDLPGYGGSTWDPRADWLEQAVEGVRQVIRETGASSPGIVGWSLGSWVARAVAGTVPDARLIVVGAPAEPLAEAAREAVRRRIVSDYPRFARSVTRLFVTGRSSAATEQWLFRMGVAVPLPVTLASMMADFTGVARSPAAGISIHGAFDQVVPMAERLSLAEDHLLPESGHAPFLESQQAFDSILSGR